MKGPCLLFTSAGRRVELLQAFRRAYAELGLESHIVATDIDPLAPALRVADKPYIVPRLDHPDYIATVLDVCRREGVQRVFPLIDPDIPVLARHREQIEATGAGLAGVGPEAAAVTADKHLTQQFFESLELCVPRSWLPEDIEPELCTYPLFIKPRRGSAAKDAVRVRNERELVFFLDYIEEPIVQELLPGPEITCDVVCDVDGSVLSVVARRRIEVRWGEVAKGVTVHEPSMLEDCVTIARALPARGPITVQCMLKDGRPHYTEINARLGGGFPLGVAAGDRSPFWLVARAAGITVTIPPIGSYRSGTYMTRFDDSFFLTEDELHRAAGFTS